MTQNNDERAPDTTSGAHPPAPIDERISAAELRVWLDWLGLPQRTAAELLSVREDTLRRWLSARDPIPVRVGEELEAIDAFTATAVGELITALHDARDPGVLIYRADAALWAIRPELRPYGAAWWRMVVARATAEVPGIPIAYHDQKHTK